MGPLKKTSAAVAGVSRGACGVTTSSSFIVVSSSSLSSKASHFCRRRSRTPFLHLSAERLQIFVRACLHDTAPTLTSGSRGNSPRAQAKKTQLAACKTLGNVCDTSNCHRD